MIYRLRRAQNLRVLGSSQTLSGGRALARLLASGVVVLLLLGKADAKPHAMSEQGTASFYGWFHHGRLMANGRRFHALEATVASRTLPLGMHVRITNLDNGRHAPAEVTDRGPYVGGRVADVSLGVARSLGMERAGLARVSIEPVDAARTRESHRHGRRHHRSRAHRVSRTSTS